MLSSIKDGRYEEQSYRLNGLSHHNHNIVYLIEGDVNKVNRFKQDNPVRLHLAPHSGRVENLKEGNGICITFDRTKNHIKASNEGSKNN